MKIFSSLTFYLLALFVIAIVNTSEAKISFNLDRSEIHENETFRLKILIDNINNLQSNNDFSFIPQELQQLSRQQFNNSSMVNGKFSSQMGWELQLLATQAGTYTIPSFKLGNEVSQPFTIRVLPAIDELKDDNTNATVKIRAALSTEDAYVQQQIIFTVRLYRSVTTRHQSITPLQASNSLVEKLGDDRNFRMVQGSTTYNVLEQQYAIFPQQSGELIIEPMTYSATVLDSSEPSSPWLSRTKPISLSTQRYTVQVKPKPQNAQEPWLPASNLKLEASWQPADQTFHVGSPATLDFIIKGTGLLKAQLPEIVFPEVKDVKLYRDTPQYRQIINRLGINSYHLEKIAVIPSKEGQVTIPEISIPWWNVQTDKQEYATLPSMTINVLPSLNETITTQEAIDAIPTSEQKQIPELFSNGTSDSPSIWFYATLTMTLAWLLTLILLVFAKRSNSISQPKERHVEEGEKHSRSSNSTSLKAIKEACLINNAKLTASLLLTWCSQQQHLQSVSNLNQLIAHCDKPPLIDALNELQQALYSSVQQWKGAELSELLHFLPKADASTKQEDVLPKLYD